MAPVERGELRADAEPQHIAQVVHLLAGQRDPAGQVGLHEEADV